MTTTLQGRSSPWLHTTSVVVTLPLRTVSELNVRNHWARRANRVREQRFAACVALISRRPLPALPVVVTLSRIAPRALDDDNLRGALKACRDGVADALGVDDRDPRVTWQYDQRRGGAREYAVGVRIEHRPG